VNTYRVMWHVSMWCPVVVRQYHVLYWNGVGQSTTVLSETPQFVCLKQRHVGMQDRSVSRSQFGYTQGNRTECYIVVHNGT